MIKVLLATLCFASVFGDILLASILAIGLLSKAFRASKDKDNCKDSVHFLGMSLKNFNLETITIKDVKKTKEVKYHKLMFKVMMIPVGYFIFY